MQEKENPKEIYLSVKLYTWNSNTDGIFNYKYIQSERNSSIKVVEGNFNESLYLTRRNNSSISRIRQNSQLREDEEEILFRIRRSFKNNSYEIISPISLNMKKTQNNIDHLNNCLWYVVKSEGDFFINHNEDYYLNQNDIFKLGRKKFEIIKLNINSNSNMKTSLNSLNYNISELNKEKGPIFDININENQYIINESQNKNKEIENKEKINKEKEEKENKKDNLKEDKKNEEENDKDKLNEEKDNEKETIEKHNNNQINNTQIQINADDNENSNLVNEINNNDNNNINGEEEDNIINKCRICFETYSSEDNPKICLCSCKDCIHLACLKYYIKTKIEFHENEKGTVKTYICNKFNCEVCLMPYPLRFRIPKYNRIYELVDLRMPSELNYVVIESLDYIKEHNNIKTIYLVQLTDDEYHIGRYDSNDIIDTDISVSRNHATLKFNREKGKIYLENRSEKFGTLVLIKNNLKMKEKIINFQVGRTYINAKLEENNNNECIPWGIYDINNNTDLNEKID